MEVMLKLATSLDARIALANGESRWITGPQSRAEVHRLRAWADIIVTGRGTIEADDPKLTVRDVDGFKGRQPDIAILDSTGALSPRARVLEPERRVIVCTRSPGERMDENLAALKARGVEIETLAPDGEQGGKIAFGAVMENLKQRGYERVMIEAGGTIASSALASAWVTRLEWFRAPIVLGGDAGAVFAPLGLERLDRAPRFVRTGLRECGADIHETYERETR